MSIAHEAIPGYMGAMTMSFEPKNTEQLARFAIGDRVSFTFTDTDDGRRVIESITKR
ncbi:MAG: copper-binding protein [Myxococcales bacterium]|nr:copper-binding protein [Myxococcales bacterium]